MTSSEPTDIEHLTSPIDNRRGFSLRALALPSLFLGLSIGLITLAMLVFTRGWDLTMQTGLVALIYGVGASLAVVPGTFLVARLIKTRSWMRVFALAALIALATVGFTACLFALEYRIYFTQWHGEIFSALWLWQQFFTAAGAVYQYVVLGLGLYLPFGLAALFVTSWWVNRLDD